MSEALEHLEALKTLICYTNSGTSIDNGINFVEQEIQQLQSRNAELVEALERIANMSKDYVGCGIVKDGSGFFACKRIAEKALAK